MIKGSTIIFTDDYISELKRHRDNAKKQLDVEIDLDVKKELEKKFMYFHNKVEHALDFQDVVEEVINVEVPRITTIKTISGIVVPAKNVQVLD